MIKNLLRHRNFLERSFKHQPKKKGQQYFTFLQARSLSPLKILIIKKKLNVCILSVCGVILSYSTVNLQKLT